MEQDLQSSLRGDAARLEIWWKSLDHESVLFAVLAVCAVLLLRNLLARSAVGLLKRMFLKSSATFGTKLQERLERLTKILIIALTVFLLIEALELPQVAGGLLRKAVATVVVAAVFSTLYQLSANLVAVLMAGQFEPVMLESDWTTRVTQFAIFIFGIAAILEVWNVDISGALTGVGVLGAGLAIAAQDLVRNLIAGMTNQSEERFVTGDSIEIEGGVHGTVKRIDLRSTLVIGFDQVPRHVPNAQLSNSVVKNYSRMEKRRVLVTFYIDLSATRTQLEQIRTALEEHLNTSGDFDVSESAPRYVHIAKIGEVSIEMNFYAWTTSGAYSEYIAVCDRLALHAKDIIESVGTTFAYPKHTVHLLDGKVPTDESAPDAKADQRSSEDHADER